MKILFVSAEVAPFAKTGGLGDVCGSLPKALAALGHDVRVVLPAYGAIEDGHATGRLGTTVLPFTLDVPAGGVTIPAGVLEGKLPGSNVPVYFIAEKSLLGRPRIYGYEDDPFRFAYFCRAALDLVPALGFKPDVVHGHDWHAAPAIAWLATTGPGDPRYGAIPTVFTIHNLAHQGRAPRGVLEWMGVTAPPLREDGWGEVNFMARGIYHATMINTVSPTYAREIMTPEGGSGLHELLRFRHYDVHGILNGLDEDVWDPAIDPHLAHRFGADDLDGRIHNKRALQARAGIPVRDDVPLVAMVTRLDRQKGLDILGHVVHLLLNDHAGEAQFVVLGSGAPEYEQMLAHFADYHRGKMAAFLTYAPDLAPLIYGGADVFLMPSLFEPCGLGQLIAMRYGAVPVVRATGGLADTVRDGVTGFTFVEFGTGEFWNALQRALYVHRVDDASWRSIQRNGMRSDFSWEASARGYQQLYEWATARVTGA
jgi:starch synthase